MILRIVRFAIIVWLLTSGSILLAQWWGDLNPNPRIAYQTLTDDYRDVVRIIDVGTNVTRELPTLYRGSLRFGAVQWSEDGRYLYYGDELRYGRTLDIFVYDIETDTTRAITDAIGNERYPRPSPDNQWLVYIIDNGEPPASLNLLNLRDKTQRVIEPVFTTNDLQVEWSSDSKRLAYVFAGAVYVYDVELDEIVTFLKEATGINGIQWMHDDETLLYTSMGNDDTLYRVNINDARPEPIAPFEQMMDSETTDFLLSPDDTNIVWSNVIFEEGTNANIGVAKSLMLWDGEQNRTLTQPEPFYIHQPVLWLDTDMLVYQQAYWDSRRGDLYTYQLSTGESRRLLAYDNAFSLWFPHGE